MNLSEIEEKAQELLTAVLGEDHTSRAEHTYRKLRCLREVAQIIAVGDGRIARTAELEIKKQALAAMGGGLAGPCHAVAPMGRVGDESPIFCQLQSGHVGSHMSEENGRAIWPNTGPELTKPAADRLHELVSYCTQQSNEAHLEADREQESLIQHARLQERSLCYADVGQKLQDILTEGGI
jgi:hypothetical protein